MLAAVFGILSAMLMFAFLNSRGGDGASSGPIDTGKAETVVVATKNIAVGEKIEAGAVTTRSYPAGALIPGYLKDEKLAVGQIASAPIYAGEPVITQKVTKGNDQKTLAFKVPEGMRALSLQVPHEAWIAAGLPQPGDLVDILAITTLSKTDPLTGQERPDVVSGIIAENVEILAVSQTVINTLSTGTKTKDAGATPTAADPSKPADGSGGLESRSFNTGGTFEKAISVTIALKPDQAAKVALIDAMKDDLGQYRLLPKRAGDKDLISGTKIWSFDDIFTSASSKK